MYYFYQIVCAEIIEEAIVSQSVDPKSTTSEALRMFVTYLVTMSDLLILNVWAPGI